MEQRIVAVHPITRDDPTTGSYVQTYKLDLPSQGNSFEFQIRSPPIFQVLGIEMIRDTPHLHVWQANKHSLPIVSDLFVVRNNTPLPTLPFDKQLRYCGSFSLATFFSPEPACFHVFVAINRFVGARSTPAPRGEP